MSYVVSFYGYRPAARYDGLPWTTVAIDEGASSLGPWTTIDTKTLTPADSDPSAPATRHFTTTLATLANGWYRVRWRDAALNEELTTPVYHAAAVATLATLADVQRVLQYSTLTAAQVEQLQEALEVADALLRTKLQAFDTSSGTSVFHHAVPGAGLPLPVNGASVSEVRTYLTPAAEPIILTSNLYQVSDTHVLLERRLWDMPWPYGYGTDWVVGSDRVVARVEVDWAYANGVPKPVRDAIALTTGALWSQGPKFVSGLKSERIGDYSYTFDGGGQGTNPERFIPAAALGLIEPYRKRKSVFVT